MSDISIFFEALSKDFSGAEYPFMQGNTLFFEGGEFPDFSKAEIAILGVIEDRGAVNNQGCAHAPDAVREKLYRLQKSSGAIRIVDLGNIKRGHQLSDTYFALSAVVAELLRKSIVPVIIGGGQDLTYAQYAAYESLEQTVNIVAVDSGFDLGAMQQKIDSGSYLGQIIMHEPNYLFNFSNIGYQTYFVAPETIALMEKLFFDAYRLGFVRGNMEEVEPVLRNADMISFDISAVRYADAPGNGNASPNGFYGEEACQIMRYAGMSEKLTSAGFYEVNPALDQRGQTAFLAAQMIWYFLDGFANRKKDLPFTSKQGYVKYRVAVKNTDHEIVFYKSTRSDRWWMEVPYPTSKTRFGRHHMVPCSYKDYQTACSEEMPDRWWQTFQKLV
jgi:arginase family enzyme